MNKIISLLVKYLGIPLLTRAGEYIIALISEKYAEYMLKRAQKKKEKAIDKAKTPDEIRSAHHNNKL